MYKYIKTEIHDKVLLITLNRPDALNALSPDLMASFQQFLMIMRMTTICVVPL